MAIEQDVGFVVVPPDGGWGWVIVVATFSCNLIADGILYSFGVFIEEIHKELEESYGRITSIGSLQSGFYYLVGPFVCSLVNMYGYRIVTFCGGFIAAAAYFGSSYINNFYALTICNGVIAGIGLSMIYAPSTIVIGFYFEKWRALASGISTCGSGVGTLILPPILTSLVENKGRPFAYKIITMLLLCVSLVSLFYRPLKPVRVYSEGTSGTVTRKMDSPSERLKRKCWNFPCCRKMSNRHYPTTDQVVNVKKVQVDEHIYETSSDEDDEPVSRPPQRIPAQRKKCWFFKCDCCRRHHGRPIYRDDIFYHHSLMLLPNYKPDAESGAHTSDESSAIRDKLRYHMSVTRSETKPGRPRKRWCHSLSRALTTMLDLTLLKSPAFHMYLLSGLVVIFGYLIPFLYIKVRATIRANTEPSVAVWLISTIGVCNTFGRVLCGVLPSIVKINVILYSVCCLLISGIVTILSSLPFMFTTNLQFVYAAIYGWGGACIAALRPIIVVEQFGLQHLTNAFGLQMLFQGIGVISGMFTAGALVDATGNFLSAFYMAGACLIASSLILLCIEPLRRWEKKRGILS